MIAVEAGHRSASIGHLGKIACTLNQTIKWKPKKEKIVGNDEAEAMIDRVPRDGWDFLKA